MNQVYTYNPLDVNVAMGNHIASGFADDSFVNIEQKSDGVTSKTGCDGETVRSVSPDHTYGITLTTHMYSPTNVYLTNMQKKDMDDGTGTFPIVIKDAVGGLVFSSECAWVDKVATVAYGKEAGNREWHITAANGDHRQV